MDLRTQCEHYLFFCTHLKRHEWLEKEIVRVFSAINSIAFKYRSIILKGQ